MLVTAYQAGKRRIASRQPALLASGKKATAWSAEVAASGVLKPDLGSLPGLARAPAPAHVNQVPELQERKQAAATM